LLAAISELNSSDKIDLSVKITNILNAIDNDLLDLIKNAGEYDE
jgi:hypothetical protein